MNVISQGLFANATQRFLGLCIAKDVIKIIIKNDNEIYHYLHVYIACFFFKIGKEKINAFWHV